MNYKTALWSILSFSIALVACGEDDAITTFDPATAARVEVDRFSDQAGTLFVRDGSNGLPDPNQAIDFDQGPFITQGLGPNGETVQYYNFDVMPAAPAPIYVLFRDGEDAPVAGQLNVIEVIPGDASYNDFWQVYKVTVPIDYVANSVASLEGIAAEGYDIEATNILVNCPVVPDGSTASKRVGGGSAELVEGWYRGQVASYFSFEEKALTVDPGNPEVSVSPIFVSFSINPDQPGGGPASGFKTEDGTMQTHNVVATLPDDSDYSPNWLVNAYDNADFDGVSDLASAQSANILGAGIATVNCPIISAP